MGGGRVGMEVGVVRMRWEGEVNGGTDPLQPVNNLINDLFFL